MQPNKHIKILEEMLPEAKNKGRNAREVLGTKGYQDYKEWVERFSKLTKPEIRDLNGLVSFCANALIASGVTFGATYFEAIQADEQALKEQLEQLKQTSKDELGEWDIDDEDNPS